MIKALRQILIFSQLLLIPVLGQAQQIIKKAAVTPNIDNLQKIAAEQNLKYTANKERALILAKKHNWIILDKQANGSSISLQGVTETGRPIYYETFNNESSAITTGTNKLWSGGASGLNLNGSSPLLSGKLGIWDGGAVRATHRELTGRIVNRDGATALNDHATHVAGTMISRGLNPIAKGMANGAPDLQTWNFNNDGSEIAGAARRLLVSNHSYGNLAGWRLIGANWYWYGELNVSDKEDVYYGFYGNTAQLWDNIAFNSPYYLMVKAAGNSRNNNEPAVGQPYYRYNPNIGNWELVSTGRTADMRYYNSYDVIPDHSVAKNILTVGAILALENGYTQPSDVNIFYTSSWGPTDDGRIKPDIVGNGHRVTSTFATHDEAYNYSTGTSMAAPNVSGSLILLQEHYSNRNNGNFMLAATLKGLALHTANEAGPAPGPDYIHGWGVLNTEQAAQVISNRLQTNLIAENALMQGQSYTQTIKASGLEPLRLTISWTDPAGSVLAMVPSTLNNRTPRLVNDLDIRVSSSSNTHYPWILDPNNPSAAATTGDNIRDNVEQILISNPVPGETYTVTITHKGSLRNNLQAYSLIISGLQGIQYCSSAATSDSGSRIEGVTIGQINNSSANTCDLYTNYTTQSTNVEVGQLLPLTVIAGTCDADAGKILKVFVDWNVDGDFDDAAEAAAQATIAGNGTINTAIQVPANVVAGKSTRLRLVLVENTVSEMISACGFYEKGETEDYTLNFITPSNDVGITSLTNPASSNFIANPDHLITVTLKNFGSVSQNNIPVTVAITTGGQNVATLSEIYSGPLAPQEEKTFTLTGSFAALPGTTYTFSASTALSTDNVPGNNTITTSLITQNLIQSPVVAASICPNSNIASLQGSGNGTIFWYDALVGGNLVAVGNNTTTSTILANRTYYAVLNQYNSTTANLQNSSLGNFSANNQDTIYFNAAAPFILDRVTVNAGTGGTMVVSLYNAANTLVGSSQLQVIAGVAQYPVNLTIPAAGNNYRLLVSSFGGGATANQNNAAGTLGFPYTLPALLNITKSRTGSLYLYNWKIKATGNPSARVAVKINGNLTTPANSFCAANNTGTITYAGSGTIARWEFSTDYLTWTSINHTQNSYTFSNLPATTHFRVIFGNGTCTDISSDAITVQVNPIPVAMITAGGGTKICEGSSLTLTASNGHTYLWSSGQTTQQITVMQPGNYSVQVTNIYGCTATSPGVVVSYCLTTWTGHADTNWNNSANWTNGVPDAEMDATIPANLNQYPVITTGEANCKNITIRGSLSLSGGIININENFTNTGILNQTNDALLQFSGSNNHFLTGTTFHNLRVGGSGVKVLNSDIKITGNLTVTDGIINTGNYKFILDGTASITETTNNYIVGKVMATRNFSVATSHNFGNIGLNISTTANPNPIIQVTRVTGNSAPGAIRSVKRYFDISVTSGKTNGLNATMEFTYLPSELNGLLKDNMALYRSPDNGTTWAVQEGSVADLADNNYKVSLTGISAFSVWTVSDRNANMVLPVTLTSFKAVKQKTDVVITWETATEKNAAGMEVEVSEDAIHYRSLGFVAATGQNTNTSQFYKFTDLESNKKGIRYYRLKQLDVNGDFSYYGPKAVNFEQTIGSEIIAYPNPSNGSFAILAPTDAPELMQLEIKNLAGQIIYRQQHALSKGENKVMVDLPANPPAGIYLVTAQYNNKTHQLKMVVK